MIQQIESYLGPAEPFLGGQIHAKQSTTLSSVQGFSCISSIDEDSSTPHHYLETYLTQAPGGEGANMSLIYPAGGAIGALGVVGLCQSPCNLCLRFDDG